jgi:hypothetical protein
MAYINVSLPTTRAVLQILPGSVAIANTTTGTIVASMQDITINNSNGIFNWTQLDAQDQYSVATPATNSIAANVVVDSTQFFTATTGFFDLSANKTLVQFRAYFNGTSAGAKYVAGQGYINGLAPTVNPTAPVWVTPINIAVDGALTSGTV